MLAIGTTFTATLTGRYGAFAGLGAENNITRSLNANGIALTRFRDNEPSLPSQVIDGDFFDHPYQLTLSGAVLTDQFSDASMLASVLTACVSQALASTPTSTSVDRINGVTTGQALTPAPAYGLGAVQQSVMDAFSQVSSTAIVLVLVAVVGLVLIAQSGSVKVHV